MNWVWASLIKISDTWERFYEHLFIYLIPIYSIKTIFIIIILLFSEVISEKLRIYFFWKFLLL